MKILKDSFGRTFPYIRMSITDVCNFKCGYCLPNGYQKDKSDNRKFISSEEIERLAKGLSELGVCKIRLTGGEPTVRKDFFEIIKILKNKSGIKKTVITTNGYLLNKIANQIVDSGLDGINISIDSLNRETFKNVTGHDRLPEILKGINILQDLNFENIKINAVLLNGVNSSEKDFDLIALQVAKPNFITNQSITSGVINLDRKYQQSTLNNKIILLEHADPGFDWIFSRNPSGLITKYGGVASHMSIRCSEINLPAAIGCGSMIYEKLKDASKIILDCKNQQIIPLEFEKLRHHDEEKKVLKSLGYIR